MWSLVWAVAPAVVGALAEGAAQIEVVLFSESFEGVPLGRSPQEDPTVGVEDREGWAFVDENSWPSADDQHCSEFRDCFGEGTVAVADPVD